MQIPVKAIYRGSRSHLGERRASSGINKEEITEPIRVTRFGIEEDFIGDKSIHGGLEKALHHFPADHFEKLRKAFPQISDNLTPGSIGENISSYLSTEQNVHISDIFSLGSVIMQISQPRKPCWKIDEKYECTGVATLMHKIGLCGWYYRVIQEGVVASTDRLDLIKREKNAPTVKEFQSAVSDSRPNPELLEHFARTISLSNKLAQQLINRARWLRAHGNKK